MKKFKLVFYPIYLIAIFLVLYFSMDILANMDAYKERMDMTFALRKLPIYLMISFMSLGLLMLIELIAENVQIITLRSRLKKAEEEVVRYKAMLFDKSQGVVKPEENQGADEESEDEDGDGEG